MSPHSGKRSGLAAEEILRFAQNDERGTRIIGIILTVLLAISMIPAAGIQPAFADEPVERPASTGGDAALEGYSAEAAPVATQREDGMYVAGGLVYTVTDGGLSLVGFDGLPQGEDALKEIVVPEAVSVDGKDTAVVAVSIAEGNIAESVVSLTLPQSINNVDTVTLAGAFPNLASVEVASPKASAPVAAGAAAIKAAYSSFGGILYKNVRMASESDASQTTLTKQLVWAPPATVVARIPAECASTAAGAFAACEDLKTVVCFGVMEDIAQAQKADDGTVTLGAFTDEQIATVNVIVPQTGTVVPDGERVSADVAVTDDSTMDVKRGAWWQSGFASDRITLGEVYGSTTNTLPVTEEGVLETVEAEVAYAPETTQNSSSRKAGIEPPESAIPTPVPDDDADSSESGLVFTHLADMTLSVSWKGDPTATPSHLDIPAYATVNGVAYPVTEIAPHAFEGAVFLTSVIIPEGVTAIGDSAFANCANLADATFPTTLRTVAASAFDGTPVNTSALPAAAQSAVLSTSAASDDPQQVSAPAAVDPENGDGASGDAAVTADPADPAVSEPDALTAVGGKEAPPGDDGLIPADDSISTFSTIPATIDSVWVSCYGNLTLTRGDASGNVTVDVNGANFRVIYKGDGTFGGWNVLCFGDENVIAYAQVQTNISTYVYAKFTVPDGYVAISSSLRLGTQNQVGVICARDEAVGSSELALASHDHGTTYVGTSTQTLTATQKTQARTNLGLGTLATKSSLAASDIPSLAAGKITSGTFDAARIPEISGAKITSGTVADARIASTIARTNVLSKGTTAEPAFTADNTVRGAINSVDTKAGNAATAASEAKTAADNAQKTADAKADKSVLNKSGETAFDSNNTVRGAINAVDSKADTLKKRLDDLAGSGSGSVASQIEGAFGEVEYQGLDGVANGSAFPEAFRRGHAPAIPAPEREGYEFAGWTWQGQSTPVLGHKALENAFGDVAKVTLTANWKESTKGSNCFFVDGALDSTTGGAWTSTIAVRLTTEASKTSVSGISFAANDLTGLLKRAADGSLPDVAFAVGSTKDSVSGSYGFGGAPTGTVQLADMDGGKGVWVRITIPAGGIDADRVVGSMTADDYMASIARMTYQSIA